MKLDPREYIIKDRLKNFKIIIPVLSPKGGVGKTTIAVALAVALSKNSIPVGLIDLDVTNPSTHIVLGIDIDKFLPREERGIIPPTIANNIEFMTIAYYSKENALPLRGTSIDNAIKEILAITRWSSSQILIVDTSPGISDEVLDTIHLMPNIKALVVTTPSKLALISTQRIVSILKTENVDILGVLGNMCSRILDTRSIHEFCEKEDIEFLGCIPTIPQIEYSIGDIELLYKYTSRYMITLVNVILRGINYEKA